MSEPRNVSAERAVVGALLVCDSINVYARVQDLRPEHFADPGYRAVFSALLDLSQDATEPPTIIELKEHLARLDQLSKVGGSAFVSGLVDEIPSVATIEKHAAIVLETARLRGIITACDQAKRAATERQPAAGIVASLTEAIAGHGVASSKASRPIVEVIAEVYAAADERARTSTPVGIPTGIPSLDSVTAGGLPRQMETVLAAPTSNGKTTLALNIADNASMLGFNVALYSLEMSAQAIADRIVARRAAVPLSRIRAWSTLNPLERERIDTARGQLAAARGRFFFAHRINSIVDLVADARVRKANDGLDLVVVDYLQLLEGISEDTRERTVNQIAWALIEMAKDLNVAVLALSQVTPAAQMRTNGRLALDDLRDSKAIGHHARVVLMLQRPYQQNKDDASIPKCLAKLQVEKNSEGETGDIRLHFNGDYQWFEEGECRPSCRYREHGADRRFPRGAA